MKTTVLERRATCFVGNSIKITRENIPVFIKVFGQMGLYPSVNKGIGIKVTPNGIEQEDVISLDLKYLDETVKMSVGPDRIDIVSKKAGETWISFIEFVMKISDELRKNFSNDIIRLALCASIRLKLDQKHAEEAYGKLFKSEDELPIEWQLRKVIRTTMSSDDNKNEVTVNNVYNIYRNDAIVNGENLSNIIKLDMDVNTIVGSDICSLYILQKKFWDTSAKTIDDAISIYYSIFTDEKI